MTSTSSCSALCCIPRCTGLASATTARRSSTGTEAWWPTGLRSTVESVEVDGDAVVLGLRVGRRAEGARPAPPELLYQVFTVDNTQVVEIRAYPDRKSALTRNRPEAPDGVPGRF